MRRSIFALFGLQIVLIDAFFTADRQGSLQPRLHRVDYHRFITPLDVTKESAGDEFDAHPVMSKSKWKKKRYLMMQDVIKLIEKRDKHAPRKAHEIVTRMQKLSEVHQDDTMKPDQQVYNVC